MAEDEEEVMRRQLAQLEALELQHRLTARENRALEARFRRHAEKEEKVAAKKKFVQQQ